MHKETRFLVDGKPGLYILSDLCKKADSGDRYFFDLFGDKGIGETYIPLNPTLLSISRNLVVEVIFELATLSDDFWR